MNANFTCNLVKEKNKVPVIQIIANTKELIGTIKVFHTAGIYIQECQNLHIRYKNNDVWKRIVQMAFDYGIRILGWAEDFTLVATTTNEFDQEICEQIGEILYYTVKHGYR